MTRQKVNSKFDLFGIKYKHTHICIIMSCTKIASVDVRQVLFCQEAKPFNVIEKPCVHNMQSA